MRDISVDPTVIKGVSRLIRRRGLEQAAAILGVSQLTAARIVATRRAFSSTIDRIKEGLARLDRTPRLSDPFDVDSPRMGDGHSDGPRSGDPLDAVGNGSTRA